MQRIKYHPILVWVALTAGVLLVGFSSWSLPVERQAWTISVENGQYSFTFAQPPVMRLAQDGTVRLTVHFTGNPLASSGAQTFLEARLEFAGLAVSPGGTVRQPNASAPSHAFEWAILPIENGRLDGTLWVYAVSRNQNGSEIPLVLTARSLHIRSIGLSGLPWFLVRWPGVVLIVVAVLWMFRDAIADSSRRVKP